MTKFAKGDRVKIKGTEFAGTVQWLSKFGELAEIMPDPGLGIEEESIDNVPLAWLELAEPYSWPPEVGDIWVTGEGVEFYVRAHGAKSWLNPFQAEQGLSYEAERDGEKFLALKPVLVRRRGVNP